MKTAGPLGPATRGNPEGPPPRAHESRDPLAARAAGGDRAQPHVAHQCRDPRRGAGVSGGNLRGRLETRCAPRAVSVGVVSHARRRHPSLRHRTGERHAGSPRAARCAPVWRHAGAAAAVVFRVVLRARDERSGSDCRERARRAARAVGGNRRGRAAVSHGADGRQRWQRRQPLALQRGRRDRAGADGQGGIGGP